MRIPLHLPVVGIRHYYNPEWPASDVGYVKSEPNNEFDSNAIGVFNENHEKIGHISREDTDLVRMWANSQDIDLKCTISIDVSEQYNVYRGNVEIYDTPDESYFNNPYNNKAIYIQSNIRHNWRIKNMLKAFGIDAASRFGKKIDYVIYIDDIMPQVQKCIGNPDYHFELIKFEDFIKKAIPESKRIKSIYGKVVSPATIRDNVLVDFLKDFLEIEGATYRERYSKKETDTVIQWEKDNPTQIVEEARIDGKEIILLEELLPSFKPLLRNIAPKKHTRQIEDVGMETETSVHISSQSSYSSSSPSSNSGCIVLLLVALSFMAFSIII